MKKEEILNTLLELSEKHFNEGDYITAANLLKDLYTREDNKVITAVNEDEIDEQMSNEIYELQLLIQLRYLGYLGYLGYYGYLGCKRLRFCSIL